MTDMTDMTEYYNILDIPVTATQKQIIAAYRKMAAKYHPSIDASYNEKFLKITKAYEKLFHEDIVNKEGKVLCTNDKLFGRDIQPTNVEEPSCKIQ